jgi:hypothetical protein
MNLNNIFDAFEDNAPIMDKVALLQLQETQAFKLGMFKKIIQCNFLLVSWRYRGWEMGRYRDRGDVGTPIYLQKNRNYEK